MSKYRVVTYSSTQRVMSPTAVLNLHTQGYAPPTAVLSGADPETMLTGGGAIFSIIDGTNCSPKAVLACKSVNLVFISFSVQ